jgi:indolepyruvate ferredoxin oxidoreductase
MPDNLALIEKIALLPERIRGYGHVKLRNLRSIKRQEAELLRQLAVAIPMGEAIRRALDDAPAVDGLEAIRVVASR